MKLLDAVNAALSYMGEHKITRVEGSNHPTVDSIVSAINRQRAALLSTGWWFNELHLTIPVETDGRIQTPARSLAIYGKSTRVSMEGEHLFNLDTGSVYFTEPVDVRIVRDIDFEDLPEYAAQYSLYVATAEVYSAELGVDNVVSVLDGLAKDAIANLRQENLRNRRYNPRRNAVRQSRYTWFRNR